MALIRGPAMAAVSAVSAGASAAGRVIQNTYWTGTACCPGGGGRNGETGDTAAEVIVTFVPVVR